MEQIVFPVPSICEFLTKESKLRIYYTTERDEQGSKINDFFLRSEDLFNEMNWQKKLRGVLPAHARGCGCAPLPPDWAEPSRGGSGPGMMPPIPDRCPCGRRVGSSPRHPPRELHGAPFRRPSGVRGRALSSQQGHSSGLTPVTPFARLRHTCWGGCSSSSAGSSPFTLLHARNHLPTKTRPRSPLGPRAKPGGAG